MTAKTPELKAGQWVVVDRHDGEPGYVERVEPGIVEIRLLSQWDWEAPLPERASGEGFRVIDLHGWEEEARKQADKLWHLLRTR